MKKEASPKNVEWQLQVISKQLHHIQEHLHFLTNEVKKQGNIQVHEMNLHHPRLENLTYKLDHLEIKEVSGTLNFGNNFGLDTLTKKDGKNEWGFSKWFLALSKKTEEQKDPSSQDDVKANKQRSQETVNISSNATGHSSIEKREHGYRIKIHQ